MRLRHGPGIVQTMDGDVRVVDHRPPEWEPPNRIHYLRLAGEVAIPQHDRRWLERDVFPGAFSRIIGYAPERLQYVLADGGYLWLTDPEIPAWTHDRVRELCRFHRGLKFRRPFDDLLICGQLVPNVTRFEVRAPRPREEGIVSARVIAEVSMPWGRGSFEVAGWVVYDHNGCRVDRATIEHLDFQAAPQRYIGVDLALGDDWGDLRVERAREVFRHEMRLAAEEIGRFFQLNNIGFEALRPISNEADRRAASLLWDHLNEEQRGQLRSSGRFMVRGGVSGQAYEIGTGHSGNVVLGRTRFCAIAASHSAVPVADQMLAQKLWLETDEAAFHGIAYPGHIDDYMRRLFEQQSSDWFHQKIAPYLPPVLP